MRYLLLCIHTGYIVKTFYVNIFSLSKYRKWSLPFFYSRTLLLQMLFALVGMFITLSRNGYFVMLLLLQHVHTLAEEPLHCSNGGDRPFELD
jgi:hypothetical protein